jgi:hypothetical protein
MCITRVGAKIAFAKTLLDLVEDYSNFAFDDEEEFLLFP